MDNNNNLPVTLPVQPRVSVILSAYNGESYIREAVESILNQTFTNFELILINDGSTDGTSTILASFKDPRIVLIDHPDKAGLVTRLREGVERSRGELIARMDADDISLPERLAKQVAFLDAHPEVGVLGTAMRQVDGKGNLLAVITPPLSHALIVWQGLFETTIMHATVLMKKALVVRAGNYNPDYIHVEDTELWDRLIDLARFANLPDPLYVRRWISGSVSYQQAPLQRSRSAEIRMKRLQKLLGRSLPDELATALKIRLSYPARTFSTAAISKMITALIEVNQKLLTIERDRLSPDEIFMLQQDLSKRLIDLGQSDRKWLGKMIYRWLRSYAPYSIKNWTNRLVASRRSNK